MYGHQYTEEEHEFMKAYVPGHSYQEIQSAFIGMFGWEISIGQIKSYLGNHHLKTGRITLFQKGRKPHNKGKKGVCFAGCEKTWFQKGNRPANYRPIGSERISKDGYIEIKVADPSKWEMKHKVVWESVNGKLPKDCRIIFKDNDRTNISIDNLLMVKNGTHAVLNHTGLCKCSSEFKETAVCIAELKIAAYRAKKRRKTEQ